MRSLRRLSVVSAMLSAIILVLCSASLPAQTATTPPSFSVPLQNAPPLVAPLPPLVASPKSAPQLSPDTMRRLFDKLNAQKLSPLASDDGPCYTLRTYSFTRGHDPASVPRLSSSTTCLPSSQSHLRELIKTPLNHQPDSSHLAR